MVIVAKEKFGNGCVGSLFYPSLVGGLNIDILEPLVADLDQIDIVSFSRSIFAVNLNPVLRVTSSLDEFPFYSVPEPRYKLGSYALIFGNDIVVNEEDEITVTPYLHHPEYIVYPLQRLSEFRMVVKYPNPSVFDYDVIMEEDAELYPFAQILDVRKFAQGFMRPKIATGLQVNLSPGVTVDLKIYYTCVVASVQDSSPDNVITYVN